MMERRTFIGTLFAGFVAAKTSLLKTISRPPARTAIMFDNASRAAGVSAWSHTINTEGTKRILCVAVNGPVDRVTFAGKDLSLLSRYEPPNEREASSWYLSNPPVGTHRVQTHGPYDALDGIAASYSNVDGIDVVRS